MRTYFLETFDALEFFRLERIALLSPTRPALLRSYAYVNPVVAVFLGVVLAGEAITPAGFVGIAVILAGIVLAVTAKAKGKTEQV